MKKSIAAQIAVIFIGLMVLVLAGNLAVNSFFLERYYISRFQRTLIRAYEQIDAHITYDGLDETYFEGDFSQITTSNNLTLVVVDENYQVVIRTKDGTSEIMAARIWGYMTGTDTENSRILKKTDQYTIQMKADQRMDMDFLEMWGDLSNGYHFMLRIPFQNIANNARISNEFMLYFSVLAILISIILIVWVSRRIANPIKELTKLSERMANLDFDAKYESGGEDEIGQLGEHFNRMSDKLEKTISQLKSANNALQLDIERKTQIDDMRKEFLSNVSHELKTPLALISGYAEGLHDCINDDADREYYCDVIMDEAGKMSVMVQKLLTLNQLEFGQDQTNMERFDLGELIRGKIASTAILAGQKQVDLRYIGEDTIPVWGDEFKVEEVLNNYISNAFNHVDGERIITVSTVREERLVRTQVYNTGSRIPDEELDKIWIKFYKVDKARTREYGGSGVGLSIVKAIMDSMNQRYGVENTDDGVIFWFELERADIENLNQDQQD